MPVDARLERKVFVPAAPMPRQRGDGHGATTRVRPQPPRQLITVHPGQIDIQQDHVGPDVLRRQQRRLPVVRGADRMPRAFQQLRKNLDHHRVIIDDQNALAWRR